ncbi:Lrp/AsnC family transcriptional regulator [Shouchella patagoniensis]|uniref:Lrp/AsnC family transcriptional regulator n=1 Tax=Shouchella patagoniensis TaxID=228576 RepID=UPI0009949BBF|nr:Lrp/AsnC family transcriptional regulator [Shouchella patagoniensis]
MEKLDELDFLILGIFQKDGKCSYSEVARNLNVSEGTVRQRTKKMRTNEVFDFMICINPEKLGLSVKAIISLNTKLGKQDQVGKWLASFNEIHEVSSFSGYHDLMIQAYFKDNEALVQFVNNDLARSDGIAAIDVSIQLMEYKNSFSYLLSNKSGKTTI